MMELWTNSLSAFLSQYQWLMDSYVIEFFTENHWDKLPRSWRESLCGVDLTEVSQLLLNTDATTRSRVYPLSLLAFTATAHSLSFPRTRQPIIKTRPEAACQLDFPSSELSTRVSAKSGAGGGKMCQISGVDHLFRRHVKPKKQHEIKLLGEIVFKLSQLTGCRNIIDIGSGQGHLARYIAFHYGLNVTAVEAVGCHLETAAKFDSQVKRDLEKRLRREASSGTLRYVETLIHPDVSATNFLSLLGVEEKAPDCSSEPATAQYILIGLHTCGDLAPTMLRVYSQSNLIVGLVSVGCCYMKVTCGEAKYCPVTNGSIADSSGCGMHEYGVSVQERGQVHSHSNMGSASCGNIPPKNMSGYPLSTHVKSLPHHSLSYEAREVACHSVETYRERLQEGSEHLRVHCHRAVVETILKKNGLRRSQVKIGKRVSKLPFKDYAQAVLQSVGLPADLDMGVLGPLLSQWERVTIFFILRLVAAPCVETLLLLDRALFLQEQGYPAEVVPVFDPLLSPRNLLILSHKP